MDKIPIHIVELIKKYIELLGRNNIPIKEAFLFGSYAHGNFGEYSDIDLALVSEIFEGDLIADRHKIRNITLSVSNDLEVIPFIPEDFNEDHPFAKEIIQTGVRIC